MKFFLPVLIAASLILLFVPCASTLFRNVYPTLLDGKCDSEFRYRGCSERLEVISSTVRRISVKTIVAFLKRSEWNLLEKGYDILSWLKQAPVANKCLFSEEILYLARH